MDPLVPRCQKHCLPKPNPHWCWEWFNASFLKIFFTQKNYQTKNLHNLTRIAMTWFNDLPSCQTHGELDLISHCFLINHHESLWDEAEHSTLCVQWSKMKQLKQTTWKFRITINKWFSSSEIVNLHHTKLSLITTSGLCWLNSDWSDELVVYKRPMANTIHFAVGKRNIKWHLWSMPNKIVQSLFSIILFHYSHWCQSEWVSEWVSE